MAKTFSTTLGIDVGSNSIGSAWLDTTHETVDLAVSVFPAGVEESDKRRGEPLGRTRRTKRSMRRSIRRRSQRKRELRRVLVEHGLLPPNTEDQRRVFQPKRRDSSWQDPWELRKEGLDRELTPDEFARVIIHLNQRRGAIGLQMDEEDEESGRVKEAIGKTEQQMKELKVRTFGELVAKLRECETHKHQLPNESFYRDPVRNRRDQYLQHADRNLIYEEFVQLWDKQRAFDGALSALLTDELYKKLCDRSDRDSTWREKGAIFGQRNTYWDRGTLGRCILERSAHPCPHADMYASEFLVLETVNRIKVEPRGEPPVDLTWDEKQKVAEALRNVKSPSVATVRKALGIHKGESKTLYALNIEREKRIELNSDWFGREIVDNVFSREGWKALSENQQQSVNRALQKIDDEQRLRENANQWWGLDDEQSEKLIRAWKARPSKAKRLNVSRIALQRILPHMRPISPDQPGVSFSTAKKLAGYADRPNVLNKRDRQFLIKHRNSLPPAPKIANPVVRKAVHEIRRHVTHWIQVKKQLPDRIVIEYARGMTLSAAERNKQLENNRKRESHRRKIQEEFKEFVTQDNPLHKIVERVKLWAEQKGKCAYTMDSDRLMISRDEVGKGSGLEIDHIIPRSRGGDNGFNNKVLCRTESNRDKRNKTPIEWLQKEEFQKLEQRLEHLRGKKAVAYNEYESAPNPAKWRNLHATGREPGDFALSQLSDTAFAAKIVASYLRDALYDSESDGTRRVYTTKGNYTALLRRDWGLQERPIEPLPSEIEYEEVLSRLEKKDRRDHRHHAVDAAVIALCGPERIVEVAEIHKQEEEFYSLHGQHTRRPTLEPPWKSFREDVVSAAKDLIVRHRPVKRKLSGALHEETCFGIVDREAGLYTIRMPIYRDSNTRLKPAHLRLPEPEDDRQVMNRLTANLISEGLSKKAATRQATELFEKGDFNRTLVDPSVGKSGLVRDWELRRILRVIFLKEGLDPDEFSEKDLKALWESDKFRMESSVPIKSAIILRVHKEPVIIEEDQTGGKPPRIYVGGNNHHMEILQDKKTGKWSGYCTDMFTVARRIKPPKGEHKLPMVLGRQLDELISKNLIPEELKSRYENQSFVMSLSEGEMVKMKNPDMKLTSCKEVDYFVLAKLDKAKLHFIHHTDARPASGIDTRTGAKKAGIQLRELITISPTDLVKYAIDDEQPPTKVIVMPDGSVSERID